LAAWAVRRFPATGGGEKTSARPHRGDLRYREESVGVLAVWILLGLALALDIAALLWGTLLSVVVLTVAVLVAGATLKMNSRRP
jgi:hypothetical protein